MRNSLKCASAAVVLLLGACSAVPNASPDPQIAQAMTSVQSGQAKVQGAINTACGDVNAAASLAAPFALIPQVGSILDFATASCGTADAVAALVTKAVTDPTTVGWALKLAADIKRLIPAKA